VTFLERNSILVFSWTLPHLIGTMEHNYDYAEVIGSSQSGENSELLFRVLGGAVVEWFA